MSIAWGRCPCGGHYETRRVEVRVPVDNERVTLENVRQGFCPVCESRVYKARDLEEIEALMSGRPLRPLT